MSTPTVARFLLPLLATASIAACATAPAPALDAEPMVPATYVRAENRNYDDLDLQLVVGGAELPLGPLPAHAVRTFMVPPRYVVGDGSEYQLIARPRGQQLRLVSPSFPMRHGQTVSWTIEYQPRVLPMARAG